MGVHLYGKYGHIIWLYVQNFEAYYKHNIWMVIKVNGKENISVGQRSYAFYEFYCRLIQGTSEISNARDLWKHWIKFELAMYVSRPAKMNTRAQ